MYETEGKSLAWRVVLMARLVSVVVLGVVMLVELLRRYRRQASRRSERIQRLRVAQSISDPRERADQVRALMMERAQITSHRISAFGHTETS